MEGAQSIALFTSVTLVPNVWAIERTECPAMRADDPIVVIGHAGNDTTTQVGNEAWKSWCALRAGRIKPGRSGVYMRNSANGDAL